MENILLNEEERKNAELIINTIKNYEDGDESLEDSVVEIIRRIYKFTKYTKKIEKRYRRIIQFYKITSRLLGASSKDIEEIYESVEENYSFYVSSAETLKKYLDVGFETDEFPDLEAAYLLTIYLTNIEFNINDYLKEISQIDLSVHSGYAYSSPRSSDEKCEERTRIVRKLVDSINSLGKSHD